MLFKFCTSLSSKPDHPSSLSKLIWHPLQAIVIFIGTLTDSHDLKTNAKCFSYVCVMILV